MDPSILNFLEDFMAKDQFKKSKEELAKQPKIKKVLHFYHYTKPNGATGIKSQFEDFVPVVVAK
jgi:hypothetical protein